MILSPRTIDRYILYFIFGGNVILISKVKIHTNVSWLAISSRPVVVRWKNINNQNYNYNLQNVQTGQLYITLTNIVSSEFRRGSLNHYNSHLQSYLTMKYDLPCLEPALLEIHVTAWNLITNSVAKPHCLSPNFKDIYLNIFWVTFTP